MSIQEPKKIYGVLGYPVKHSLSPAMHNAAFKALNINAEYKLFEVEPEELGRFFVSLRPKNIRGLNVTIPYKEKAVTYMDSASDNARLIGAVNTVRVSEKGLEGFNTDGEGFLKHLTEDLKFDPAGKIISIIGAGGAARAVSVCLCGLIPKRLNIYDIDNLKLSTLVRQLKYNFGEVQIEQAGSIGGLAVRECDLLVNATPAGMNPADPCPVDEESMHPGLLVYDLVYNPQETKLLKLARKKGARASNGLGMLLYQGMVAFEIWTAQKPPKEIMQKALSGALEAG
ncbi:MAG: shikimate dehydrogenase [Deltaproteobacteria bacterium]